MASLKKAGRAAEKRFWITSAFPEGLHPQVTADGSHVTVKDVVTAALGEDADGQGGSLPAADGVGANCTNPRLVEALSRDFEQAVFDLKREGQASPTLVLYPDGGSVYDVVTRTWSTGSLDSASWGKQVAKIARRAEKAEVDGQTVWEGVIVGGCCKAGFGEIKALRTALDGQEGSRAENQD
jgi:homocysteine S-methyltransferase